MHNDMVNTDFVDYGDKEILNIGPFSMNIIMKPETWVVVYFDIMMSVQRILPVLLPNHGTSVYTDMSAPKQSVGYMYQLTFGIIRLLILSVH